MVFSNSIEVPVRSQTASKSKKLDGRKYSFGEKHLKNKRLIHLPLLRVTKSVVAPAGPSAL